MIARKAGVLALLLVLVGGAPAVALEPGPAADVGTVTDGARCLRATGQPGQLVLQAPKARDFRTEVRVGLVPGPRVDLGVQASCAEVASGGGRLLLAALVQTRSGGELRAAFGPGAPVQTLARGGSRTGLGDVQVAVGPGGQAAVVWTETALPTRAALRDPRSAQGHVRVRLVRARAGEPLGAPVTVVDQSVPLFGGAPATALGIDGAGRLTLATLTSAPAKGEDALFAPGRLAVRTAADGAALGAAQTLVERAPRPSDLALGVHPDGSALLAVDASGALEAWTRPPGATRLQPRVTVTPAALPEGSPPALQGGAPVTSDVLPGAPGVVAGPGETGVIAWTGARGGAAALTLGAGGAPQPVRTLVPEGRDDATNSGFSSFGVGGVFETTDDPEPFAIFESTPSAPSLALSDDGHVAVGLITDLSLPSTPVAWAATGTLGGGVDPPVRLTGPTRQPVRVAAYVDPAGAPAVAWTDETPSTFLGTERPAGRLGLTAASADPAADAAPPAASLSGPSQQTTVGATGFEVPVRCEAACAVRVQATSTAARGDIGLPLISGGALAGPGTVGVDVGRFVLGGRRASTLVLRLRVAVTAPRGRTARTLTRTITVRMLPPRPAPRLLDLRARRVGSRAIVTFRVPGGLGRFRADVFGSPVTFADPFVAARATGGGRYRAEVPVHPGRTRAVVVSVTSSDPADASRQARVKLP